MDERCICPHCGKTASGRDEIEEKFGYRNMGDGRIIKATLADKKTGSDLDCLTAPYKGTTL